MSNEPLESSHYYGTPCICLLTNAINFRLLVGLVSNLYGNLFTSYGEWLNKPGHFNQSLLLPSLDIVKQGIQKDLHEFGLDLTGYIAPGKHHVLCEFIGKTLS